MRYRLSEESRVEEFGDELLICSPANAAVHRMVGPAADAVRTALAAGHAGVELSADETTLALVGAGILVQTSPQGHEVASAGSRISRRRMIGVGAAAAGAVGLVTMALPGAAAAASGGDPGPDPDPVVASNRTGLEYPEFVAPDPNKAIGIRWTEVSGGLGGGGFVYTATITGPTISTITVPGLNSSSSYTSVTIPDWPINETITVSFQTTSLQNNIAGVSRTATREE